jgi:hypothetical protein
LDLLAASDADPEALIEQITECARVRRRGLAALELYLPKIEDRFLRKGLQIGLELNRAAHGRAAGEADGLARTADRLKQQGLDAQLESRGLLITLRQTVLFSSGDNRISPSAQPIVAKSPLHYANRITKWSWRDMLIHFPFIIAV